MARAWGAVAALAIVAGTMAAPAEAKPSRCDKKIVYAEGAVRVAKRGGVIVACLNDKRWALDATAVEAVGSSGPFLQYTAAGEDEYGVFLIDLRTGRQRLAAPTGSPLGLTPSGSLASYTGAASRTGYGVHYSVFSFPDEEEVVASYSCSHSGCDPAVRIDGFALAPDATAYWRYGDGRLDAAVRSDRAARVPPPPPFKPRKRPCTVSIVSARNQRRVAALTATKRAYCLGGKLRSKLGAAHGFHWAGDWLTYFRREGNSDALRRFNVVTGDDHVLDTSNIRTQLAVVDTLEDGTVVWTRRSSGPATTVELLGSTATSPQSRELRSWCKGVACQGEQSQVIARSFAVDADGIVFWRAPDGTLGSAAASPPAAP